MKTAQDSAPATEHAPAAQPAKLPRDVRVDHYGLADELAKHFAAPLKERIKLDMRIRAYDRVEGDLFQGVLSGSGTVGVIDAGEFVKLCRRKKVRESKILAAMSVNKRAAAELLSGEEIERITLAVPREQSLTVSRLKDAPPDLVDAVRRIGAAVECDARNRDQS